MSVRRSVLCSLVLLALPGLARSQALAPEIVAQINAATRARVRLVGGGTGMLYAPRADSTGLAYDHAEAEGGQTVVALPRSLPVGQIAEIQVTQGSHAGSGARIGGGLGAGLALLAVLACEGSICEPSAGQAGAAVIGWTFLGAGVGALIGSVAPRWKTVYAVR